MATVHPFQASSFGSVFADSPGMMRDHIHVFNHISPASAVTQVAIVSGSSPASDTHYNPLIAPLSDGDALHIFGIQGACGSAATPMLASLKTGPVSANDTNPTLATITANRNGPWFQAFELPITVEGLTAGLEQYVYLDVLDVGDFQPAFNSVCLQVYVYRRT